MKYLALCVILLSGLLASCRQAGTSELISVMQDDVGNPAFVVVARYGGLLEGWSIASYYLDADSVWKSHYLDHETSRWKNVTLERDGSDVEVLSMDKLVAVFSLENKEFQHLIKNHTYVRPMYIIRTGDPLSIMSREYPKECGVDEGITSTEPLVESQWPVEIWEAPAAG